MCVSCPVAGSTRDTRCVAPGPLPIHSAPAPAAMSVGRRRGLKARITLPVRGSTRETLSSAVLSTQTLPSPTAMLLGAVSDPVNEAMRFPSTGMAASPSPVGRTGPRSAAEPSSRDASTIATAVAASTSTPAARIACRRRSSRGGTTIGCASAARASAISSPHDAYRSPGSLASALTITRSSAGNPGNGGGGSCMCAHSVSASVAR